MNQNQILDELENLVGRKINKVNTAIPGTIQSYSNGRAVVKPQGTIQYDDGREIEYPLIYNVPIIFPTGMGGAAGITFPIQSGDGCLLVFSQNNMQTFLSKTSTDDQRHFQLSDAICIPGLYTGAFSTVASNANDVCLFNAGSKVALGSSGFSGNLSDGTVFSISGNDLVVGGISLKDHVHGGVTTGGSVTGKPQ